MNVIVYFFVALVAAGSVLFGLDVVPAPMSPMPASKYEIRAAVLPTPPAPVVAKVEPSTAPAAPVPAAPVAAAPVAVPAPVVAAPVVPSLVPEQQPSSIMADEPVAAAAPAPRCDVDACAAAYRTFDAADCTYKPSEGPRRLCTKGTPPAAVPTAATPPSSDARAQACNVAACSQAYPRSFSADDCTFMPAVGPRRACTR